MTTHNSERTLFDCLSAIKNQSYKPIDIIVSDNLSNDRTREISLPFTDRFYSNGPEGKIQRNFGASQATGEYLLFLDSDMILSDSVVQDCINQSEKGLYIPERIKGQGFWIKVRNFERSFYNGTVIDAIRFVERESFIQIGGYDESLLGTQDWDFDHRFRNLFPVGIVDSYLTHDESNFTLSNYLHKKQRWSDSFDSYKAKWNNDSEVRKQFGAYYRLFGVFTEKGKWKRFLSHPILAISVLYLKFRVALAVKSKRQ